MQLLYLFKKKNEGKIIHYSNRKCSMKYIVKSIVLEADKKITADKTGKWKLASSVAITSAFLKTDTIR